MLPVFIILILLAAGGAVFAVVRGLRAFAQTQTTDLDENGVPKSLAVQNKMMFSRVKWQAIAVVLIVLLMLFSQAS